MGNPDMSPETNTLAALTAQVEAALAVANEIPELNRKPEQLQEQGIDPATVAGRYAVNQIVDMSTAVTDRLRVMVGEIDYEAILAAPYAAHQGLTAWEAAADAITLEVERAGQLQEKENAQIAAILGCRFEAADEMVKLKMQEKADELRGSMPDPAEKDRLQGELDAARALFVLACKPWPIPTAHWKPKPPEETKPTLPTFAAPEQPEPELEAETSLTSRKAPISSPFPATATTVTTHWPEDEYSAPARIGRPGQKVSVPSFSTILKEERRMPAAGMSTIFSFAQPGESAEVTGRVTAAVEAAPEAQTAEPLRSDVEPAPQTALSAAESVTNVESTSTSPESHKKLPERIIAFMEGSKNTLFLAETIADNVYESGKKPKFPASRVLGCFNVNREDSKPLRERWEAAGLELQYGKIELPVGDPRNLTGGKAVYKTVYRLVEAGTRKDPGERFEGRPVHWETGHRFSVKRKKAEPKEAVSTPEMS